MSQVRIHAREISTVVRGSYRAHEDLLKAVLQLMALRGLEPIPIHTGPRVAPREGGGFDLRKNTPQIGFGDAVGFLPPRGRTVMVECKTGRARRSPAQVRMHHRLTRNGVICTTVRAGAIAAFDAFLVRAMTDEIVAAGAPRRAS